MINTLRTKIARTSMIATNIVLISAIIIIFFTGFTRLESFRKSNMQRALDFPIDDRTQSQFEKEFDDMVLVVYSDGNIDSIFYGESFSSENDDFVKLVKSKVGEIVQSGKTNDNTINFNYLKQVVDDNTVKIVFFNPENSSSGFFPWIRYAIYVLIVGVFSHSIISMLLAQAAIRPVEESWNKQRQFVADASHELKTPLSVIMANTEIIASHPDQTVASQMKWINNTLAESKRMASLVADLLFLAKSDDGAKVEMQPTNLTTCVDECVLTHEAVFYENGKEFASQITQDIIVLGNEGQLKQLVKILLDNANKYSIEKGNISLSLTTHGKQAILCVSNDSNEVTDEQIKHIFDRFYTTDVSRNKSKGGNGLGLSIAERICQTHNGAISAEYKNGRMTFKAVLPLSRSKKSIKNIENKADQ